MGKETEKAAVEEGNECFTIVSNSCDASDRSNDNVKVDGEGKEGQGREGEGKGA